jgi:hypothetical protein
MEKQQETEQTPDHKVFVGDEMKYVVVEVDKDYLLATAICERRNRHSVRHRQVVSNFADKIGRSDLFVHGGGRISIDHQLKTIRAYEESFDYGEAHTETVTKLLTEAMEKEGMANYQLIVKGTNNNPAYVRRKDPWNPLGIK